MEPTILNLNDIPAHLARRSVVAALTFIKRIEEVYQPRDLANIDFSLAKGIRHLHDFLTADFRPMPPDFSIAVHCSDPVQRGFEGLDEPLSCALSCKENLLSFGCSACINDYAISETLFCINLARPEECGSLPQLLSWVAISEMIFQENLTCIDHRFPEEFFTQ